MHVLNVTLTAKKKKKKFSATKVSQWSNCSIHGEFFNLYLLKDSVHLK